MITVAKNAGFCFGVKRAVDELQRRIDEKSVGERIFTLGSLIHNNVFNEGLVRQGVTSVTVEELPTLAKSASKASPITVIVRAHGIPRETEEMLIALSKENESFRYVDCTCPFVKKIHKIAEEHSSPDKVLLLFGKKEHPEVIPDLKKLMDYYLPMTVKLLTAYADMDAQPVQGGNIESAKREIEGTLDTLNRAFEKLLDELFQETALDVSSDITVLQTLLAQEGLTDDELSRLRH